MKSIWTDTAKKPEFESLNGDLKTDILIIGGGLTGILCAYMLEKSGIDYTLIEANEICSGITKNTTAKITAQHGLIYNKIISKYSLDTAKEYYNFNSRAVEIYREMCKEIECKFEEKSAFVYSLKSPYEISDEINAYLKMGVKAEFVKNSPLPFKTQGAVKLENQGQINPLEFLYKISQNLNIKEHTKLINFAPDIATTDKGKIRFKTAIFATHFPYLNKHGFYFLKLYQHRSYVIALENAQELDGMYVDADLKGFSFRNYKNLLLLGGGSHRTGKKGGSYPELYDFAKKYYPKSTVKANFATQDCMSLDSMPYIGRYSEKTPNLLVATGYNKWGFTTAMVAAEILCGIIKGDFDEKRNIFSPSRSILTPQLAINSFEAVTNLLTFTKPRCPHLGCALKYNRQEHSWDCSCHGSRFTKDGKLIDNPATDDIDIK